MANKPFEYTIINPLERPTSTDINQLQAQAHYDVRLLAEHLFAGADGFLGDSGKAVPLPVPSLGFSWTPGIMFTVGTAENNIGAIYGLSDSYLYKATNIAYRAFNVTNAPLTVGYVRYDLLQVRALTGTERLTDPTSVGIYTPSLGTFDATSKDKTLTSSLDSLTTVEEVAYNVTGTAPLVYKSGQEIAYPGSWSLVPKPAVDAGYLAVAYIRRFQGQTEILNAHIEDARTLLTVPSSTIDEVPVIKGGTGQGILASGEILLGNDTSPITSTAILPVSKGGTGNSSTSAPTGSVAWFDNTLDQIKYTQAVTGLYDTPVSGYLMFSNASGAPTWAPQSLHYSANHTGSYSNNTIAWTQIAALTLTDVALRAGVVRIQLQPYNSLDEEDFSIGTNVDASGGEAMIKFEISGATSRVFIFPYTMGANNDSSLAFPSFDVVVNAGDHTVTVWGKVKQVTTSLFVQKCALIASQG